MKKNQLSRLIIMIVVVAAYIASNWGQLFPVKDESSTDLVTNRQVTKSNQLRANLGVDEIPADEERFSEGQLSKYWHKATFDTVEDSMAYHLKKHGKGRTMAEYTQVAVVFYEKYKGEGRTCTLKDKTPGLKIEVGQGKHEKGGYWTSDGKIVTFWD